jgi:exodeoxyribonuclease VII small subunit
MTKTTAKSQKNYRQLSEELDALLAWFESDELDLDSAAAKYQQAMELIGQMETNLKSTEVTIKKISAKFQT